MELYIHGSSQIKSKSYDHHNRCYKDELRFREVSRPGIEGSNAVTYSFCTEFSGNHFSGVDNPVNLRISINPTKGEVFHQIKIFIRVVEGSKPLRYSFDDFFKTQNSNLVIFSDKNIEPKSEIKKIKTFSDILSIDKIQ